MLLVYYRPRIFLIPLFFEAEREGLGCGDRLNAKLRSFSSWIALSASAKTIKSICLRTMRAQSMMLIIITLYFLGCNYWKTHQCKVL